MGCCASTNKSTPPPNITHSTTIPACVSKSPPPSHEEETVKQVLSSETPTAPKPLSPPIPKSEAKRECQSPFIKSAPLLKDKERRNAGVVPFPAFSAADELSEASEICSTLSESVSASTSVTERRESGSDRRAEMRELRHRSPAKVRNRAFSGEMLREKTVGKSPGRRFEPSPGRARPAPAPAPAPGYCRRRENGESSGRRSRSPVTRAESGPGFGRAQSTRRTGKSPGRIGSGDRIRKLEGGDNKWPPPANATNESIENPLVSLECFIFL